MPTWLERLRAWPLDRQRLLPLYLLLVALNSLSFYLVPTGHYPSEVNLWHAILVLALLPFTRWPRSLPVVVHSVTALSVLLVVYVAAHTGGVNSSSLVWFSVLAIAVLLLQGARALVAWMVLMLATIFMLQEAVGLGWVAPTMPGGPEGVPWALMNHALAALSLMLAVAIYERLHRGQLRQLEARNEDLRATHHALIQAQAHKDEFVAAVGHELRTPMNAILGFNGVLREVLADQPEQLEVVDHIRHSTAQLLEVVNDILDFSQLQAGHLALHTSDFELAPLVHELSQRMHERAQAKGLGLHVLLDPDLPPALHGDRLRLQQVLHKLLDNAVKFTAQGHVSLRLMKQPQGLRIEVQDTGRGIAAERQAHIFNRFEHADVQTNRAFGGTGLGLALCQRLTRLMGGEIGVQSAPGQGALFWLALPLQPARAEPSAQAPMPLLPRDQVLRILVVDDNAVNLEVARLQLRKLWPRARIDTASSAAQALVLLDNQTFDVALVDRVMPVIDGLQLTRQIRERFPARTAHMPILALTANAQAQERAQCLAAGMNEVLHKPMDSEQVYRTVSEHVLRARV